MPRSIEQGFKDFLINIKGSNAETNATVSHRASIKSCLESNFVLKRFTRIGSFGNGTNVSGHSDVDYLACLSTSSLKQSSNRSLILVKDALVTRFSTTNISIRCPTVLCSFGRYKSEDTEIVIADYIIENNGYKVYDIADGSDGWMRICPDAHNAYVDAVDKRHNGRVKPLIRFLKAWKFYKDVPIKSFYLEMKIAKYAETESSILYDIDIRRVLKVLLDSNLSDLQDPMGISGYIKSCNSDVLKKDALSKLSTAFVRSEKAMAAQSILDIKTAFEWWNILFNNKFPSYYL